MIEISWPLLLTQVGTFLLAMVIVWKLFWGPLTQMMKDRSRHIEEDLQRAESGRKEAESAKAEYDQRLAELEEKAQQQLQALLKQGAQAKETLVREARDEAQKILEKAQRDLAQERERVLREMRQEVVRLSLTAVERLLGEGLDRKVQERVMNQFLNEMGELEKVG